MKVAVLVPSLSGGGAEFVAKEWSRYLQDQGDNVTVIVTHGIEVGISESEVTVERLGGGNLASRLKRLRRRLQVGQFDVVLAMMPYWNILSIAATKTLLRRRTRVVISGRTIDSPLGAERGWQFALQTAIARTLYRHADAYLAISHPVAAEAVARYRISRGKLWVVPNPALAKVSGLGRGEGDRSDSGVVSLIVPGRLIKQKRPELVLDVARHLQTQHAITARVIYFGQGNFEAELSRKAEGLGVEIELRGWVEHWFAECPSDSVVVLPSLLEGFGNVLIEAAAARIPSVVSSRALGVSDAVIPNMTGVLLAGDSPSEFSDGVVRAMRLEAGDVSAWLEQYTHEASGAVLRKVLHNVTNVNPSSGS